MSVIVPVCNNPDYFKHVVSTIVNQTRGNTEIIIIDESNKDCLDINAQHILLFNDPRIKHVIRKEQKGIERAIDMGIEHASSGITMLVYNKEQWKTDKEERNGILGKFVIKIIGEKNETHNQQF
jgi:glycosyltransferase involved in cell wall biosynthesis